MKFLGFTGNIEDDSVLSNQDDRFHTLSVIRPQNIAFIPGMDYISVYRLSLIVDQMPFVTGKRNLLIFFIFSFLFRLLDLADKAFPTIRLPLG